MKKIFYGICIIGCCFTILLSAAGMLRPISRIFSSYQEADRPLYRMEYSDGQISVYRYWDITPYMEGSSNAAPFLVRYYTSLDDAARDAAELSS